MSFGNNSVTRPPVSLKPEEGWHCQHWFYRFDRVRLRTLAPAEHSDGCRDFCQTFDPHSTETPARLQTFLVMGHKADFAIMMLDPDPLKLDHVHQRLLAGLLGPAIEPMWSFVSMTEVSEYLLSVEEYAERLRQEGLEAGSEEYRERTRQYAKRYEIMRRQRLQPDLPNWPAWCFYPMNKRRQVEANWFLLGFEERDRLMREHGETGMKFAGRVTQLVTAGIGLDDWEWGVTLWARNPQYIKEIVYRMRFDEASARYAEFGPFYSGYLAGPEEILRQCRICG
ncbi:MAG: hydrogen peroxide-dependent heme synthase [Thermogutta sp.]